MKNFTGKILIVLLCAVLCVFAASALTGCKADTHTLSFVTDGAPAIASVTAESGAGITPPADPVKEGYVFQGWYTSADFSGDKVTLPTVMPDHDVVYYAKFTLSKSHKLTLDVTEYGTLDVTEYDVDAGTKFAEFLADIVPQGKGDAVFACWYNNGKRLSASATMPSDDLTLTAKYTVAFTAEALKQQTDGTYPASGEEITLNSALTDGKYVGDSIDASGDTLTVYMFEESGFTFSSETQPLTLGTDASANVYRVYFARKGVRLSYDANLPTGTSASKLSGSTEDKNEYLVGSTAKVAANGYKLEGYIFAGWSRTRSGKIEFLPDQTDATVQLGNKNMTLYANWNLGVTDNAGGDDLVYVLKQYGDRVLLRRTGLEDKYGTYDAETRNFAFTDGDKTVLQGRVSSDGTKFNYLDEAYVNRTFQGYKWMDGQWTSLDSTLVTDGYGGAVYTYESDGKSKQLQGEYIAEGSLYKFDTDKTSDCFYFVLDDDNERIYVRDEEHNGVFYTVSGSGSSVSAGFPVMVLDGFGNAYLYSSQSSYEAGYGTTGVYKLVTTETDFDENFDFVTSDGTVTYCGISMKNKDADGSYYGRIQFADEFRGEYTISVNEKTRTLKLNGFGSATYVDEGQTEVTNNCTYSSVSANGTSYIYYVNKSSSASYVMRINDDGVATNVGREAGYYLQTNSSVSAGGYILAYLDGEGVALVYLVSGSEQYVVLQANYSINSENGNCTLSDTEFKQSQLGSVEEVATKYADYNDLSMRIDSDSSTFVAYDGNAGSYTYEKDGTTYTAVFDGFGSASITQRGATESTMRDYSFVTGYSDAEHSYKFVYLLASSADDLVCLRLDTTDGTALVADLYSDYGNRMSEMSGETLAVFSDKTAAVLDKSNVLTVSGTVTIGADGVYTFTASDAQSSSSYASFSFKANATDGFFYYYKADEVINDSDGGLITDGFGTATYKGGKYGYSLEKADDCSWIDLYENNSQVYRFKIKDFKLVPQDDFCRNYYSWEMIDGKITEGAKLLSLDGYGNATLYTVSMYGSFVKLSDGTYTVISDNVATVTFTDSDISGFTFRKTIRIVNSTARYAYVPQNDELIKTVTTEDGATITTDNYGEARFTQNGNSQDGYLYFVTDPLFEENTLLSMCFYTASGNGFKSETYFYVLNGDTAKRVTDASTNIYGDYRLYEDGKVKSDLLLVDWFGNATYTHDGNSLAGKVQSTGNTDEYGFVPDGDGAGSFVFTLFTVRSGDVFSGYSYTSYFKILQQKYVASLVSSDWSTIQTDGYNLAVIADSKGNVAEASYQMLTDTLLRLYFESGVYMYFDINLADKTFVQNTEDFIVVGNTLIAYNGSASEANVPDGVTVVGERAFFGSSVTKVNLNKATTIGDYAFAQCRNLSDINLADVTSIGMYAFYGCYSLKQIALPQAVTTLAAGTFYDCMSLETVEGIGNLTEIGAYAFARCSSLSSVRLTNVTSVGAYAFAQCFKLADVTTGANLAKVGAYAFAVCGTDDDLQFVWTFEGTTVPDADGYMLQTAGDVGCKIAVADVATAVKFASSDAWSTYADLIYTNGVAYGEHTVDGTTYTLSDGNRVLLDGTFVGFYSVTDGEVTLYLKSNSYIAA